MSTEPMPGPIVHAIQQWENEGYDCEDAWKALESLRAEVKRLNDGCKDTVEECCRAVREECNAAVHKKGVSCFLCGWATDAIRAAHGAKEATDV